MRRLLLAVALGATFLAPQARAADHPLAGWWLALDDALGSLTDRGLIARTQEVLLVSREGRATNALLSGATAFDNCFILTVCASPVPVLFGRLGEDRARLVVDDRTDHPIGPFADDQRVSREIVAAVRARLVLGREARPANLAMGGRQLVLPAVDGIGERVFAAIEPARLKTLWSIFRLSEQPNNPGWRCLLANATADEPAFSLLRRGGERVPDGLEAAGRAAHMIARIEDLMRTPVPDERDDTYVPVAERPFTNGMTDDVAGFERPRDAAERARLEMRHAILMRWLAGAMSAAEAEDLARDPDAGARPLGVTEDEMTALRRLVLPGLVAARLFCVRA